MSEQWYCPNCGPDASSQVYKDCAICHVCDRFCVHKPAWLVAMQAVVQYHPGGDCMSYMELAEEYGSLIEVAEAARAIVDIYAPYESSNAYLNWYALDSALIDSGYIKEVGNE